MKAMVLLEYGKDLVELELEAPVPLDDEVVLDVTACGICQTDLKLFNGVHPSRRKSSLPHVLGHEIAGVVSEIGGSVEGWQIGDKDIVDIYIG